MRRLILPSFLRVMAAGQRPAPLVAAAVVQVVQVVQAVAQQAPRVAQ
jgi:hypothetical protein